MKRGHLVLGILLLMIIIPFTNAGFWDIFKKSEPQLEPQDVSVTVGNSPPSVIINYIDSDQDNSVTLTQAGIVAVEINFNVTDFNGYSDIDDSSLAISFDLDLGGEQRTGAIGDCTSITNDGANTKEYICGINMYHYDHDGAWTATVNIDDQTPEIGQDNHSFIVEQLKAISLIPLGISFGTVTAGQPNIIGEDTEVTNEGNYAISADLAITAQNLTGDTTPSEYIPAINFNSADQSEADVCGSGSALIEDNPISIPNFVLSKGTIATPLPNRNVTHCLTLVPTGISDQIYSATTIKTIQWEFLI
ncbi:MAG: hypothetical protein KKF48_00625 [Nanoarchaeota archaeon]|nr:hypothetical protein [Nanoarchaeota archaeon]MBU1027527.1 hypothetical protein [Nanoarchaeota archaeon]